MFKGIFTPLVSIFKKNGDLDLQSNFTLIDSLIEAKIDGIILLTNIGEFFNLSLTEKKSYLSSVYKYTKNKITLLACTNDSSIENTIELSNFAVELGYDGVVIGLPLFKTLSLKEIKDYYSRIATNTTANILLENIESTKSDKISPETISNLIIKFPNIVGIYDISSSFKNTREYINKIKNNSIEFCVFSSSEDLLITNLFSGGDGIVSPLSNVRPHFLKQIFNSYYREDFKALEDCQSQINHLMSLYDVSDNLILTLKKSLPLNIENYQLRDSTDTLTEDENLEIQKILSHKIIPF